MDSAYADPLLGYRPLPGVSDEMVDPSGRVRPVWQRFLSYLGRQNEGELEDRFNRADRYLKDAGVFYRSYGGPGSAERDWPLSHIPVLISDEDWSRLSAGLIQRAELLEAITADVYGKNTLVQDGLLPPALVGSNAEFLRPLAGVEPAGGHYLHFCSFEVGRGPNGDWWVLADRTQAPSGAGFALENRVATARAFSDLYAEMHVHRLASFFGTFRETLLAQRRSPVERVAVLTPGPANETYFEHAYIARYLGFMLLEGEDLTVVNDRVMVRTVSGLKPVGVLWRRLDAGFADPLELDHNSYIGTPGMVQALRNGSVTMINALGSGILETRAFLAFLPRICEHLRGEALQLPSIATWWCGQEAERAYVAANLDGMVIGPAYSRLPFFDDKGQSVLGSTLREQAKGTVLGWLEAEGGRLAGQEAVTLSTTPAWHDGKLVPRPMSLRIYAARTLDGWKIMPGGFARISSGADALAIAMQAGGRSADVWVVSERPVDKPSLLPQETEFNRNMPGSLPSRAADNLYWLGRYIERAEGTIRILRAWHGRFAELADAQTPLLADLTAYLDGLDIEMNPAVPNSLVANIESALFSASNIRDRFSPDGWLALVDLAKTAKEFNERVQPGEDAARAMTVLLRKLAGFAGLVHENMYRFTGWRFLTIGRLLERGLHMTRLLGHLASENPPDGSWDLLLDIGDSVMTHRRRYNVATAGLTVTDLLALDPLNPRSIMYQLDAIKSEVEALPNARSDGQMSPLYREALRLHSTTALKTPEEMTAEVYSELEREMEVLSNVLSETYFG